MNKKQLLFKTLSMAVFAAVMLFNTSEVSAQVKIGSNPTVIAAGSVLEIESGTKGLRLPQVALTSTIVWAPIEGSGTVTSSLGMTVFNTASNITAGTGTNGNLYPAYGIGEYYWDGFGWVSKNVIAPKTEWFQSTGTWIDVYDLVTNIPITTNIIAQSTPTGAISAASNIITLLPGRTYMLTFTPGQVGYLGAGAAGAAQWYNNTTSTFQGTTGVAWPAAGATQAIGSTAVLIVRPTVTTTYSVRLSYIATAGTGLRFGNGNPALGLNQTVSIITLQ